MIHLIEQLGGPAIVGALCDVTPDAVRMWRHRGAIPPKHHGTIAAAAMAALKPGSNSSRRNENTRRVTKT
jgi:hypothetical protein